MLLSGIGVNQAFNVAEEDLRNYIENDLRPMKLIFLTVSNNSASIAQFTLFSIILTQSSQITQCIRIIAYRR